MFVKTYFVIEKNKTKNRIWKILTLFFYDKNTKKEKSLIDVFFYNHQSLNLSSEEQKAKNTFVFVVKIVVNIIFLQIL